MRLGRTPSAPTTCLHPLRLLCSSVGALLAHAVPLASSLLADTDREAQRLDSCLEEMVEQMRHGFASRSEIHQVDDRAAKG